MPAKISLGAVAAILIMVAAIAPAADAATLDDACSLLTPAQVGAALNAPVGAGSYVTPTFKKTCTWNTNSDVTTGAPYVTLMLESSDGYQARKETFQMRTKAVTSVSGLGDDAYYLAAGNYAALLVKKGNVAFKVAVYGRAPLEQKEAVAKTLAEQVVSKL